MSNFCSDVKQTEYRPPHITQPLAFHAIGTRRSRVVSPSTTLVMIPSGSHRLLHQIGRGSTTFQSHQAADCQVLLAEHSGAASGSPTPLSPTIEKTSPVSKCRVSVTSTKSHIDSPRLLSSRQQLCQIQQPHYPRQPVQNFGQD